MGFSNPTAFPVMTDSNILVSCKMLAFNRVKKLSPTISIQKFCYWLKKKSTKKITEWWSQTLCLFFLWPETLHYRELWGSCVLSQDKYLRGGRRTFTQVMCRSTRCLCFKLSFSDSGPKWAEILDILPL